MKLILFPLFVLLAVGCVSNKTYQQALDEKIQLEKDRGQLQMSLEDMKKAMREMQAREDEQKKRLEEFRDLTARFKKLIDAGTLSVRIVDGKMVVSLGSDVLFPSGSARLSEKGLQTIKDVSAQLASIPDKKYQVEGHTDNVPIKTAAFPSNWELASSRALTVVKTMMENQMPATRVSAASYGDSQPIGSNTTTEGKAQNRRIEIVIVPDLSSLPGYEELQAYSEGKKSEKIDKAVKSEKPAVKTEKAEAPANTEKK
ncbi:MAG: OmpA family protein [Bdellovibrionales bacterium]|nr:OmpA family protein [Bdellovibrionales bacterium]